ncbi:MAG TPA: hypothetical protein P5287_04410 [bacterium]|nr:hypothetical protein [bacterium]
MKTPINDAARLCAVAAVVSLVLAVSCHAQENLGGKDRNLTAEDLDRGYGDGFKTGINRPSVVDREDDRAQGRGETVEDLDKGFGGGFKVDLKGGSVTDKMDPRKDLDLDKKGGLGNEKYLHSDDEMSDQKNYTE